MKLTYDILKWLSKFKIVQYFIYVLAFLIVGAINPLLIIPFIAIVILVLFINRNFCKNYGKK